MKTYDVLVNNAYSLKLELNEERIQTSKLLFDDLVEDLEHPCNACALAEIVMRYKSLKLDGETVTDELGYLVTVSVGWLKSIGYELKPEDEQSYRFPEFLIEKGKELGYLREREMGQYNLSMNVGGVKKVFELPRLIDNEINDIKEDVESFLRGEHEECPHKYINEIDMAFTLLATEKLNGEYDMNLIEYLAIEVYRMSCFFGVISEGDADVDFDTFKAAYEAKLLTIIRGCKGVH